MRSVSLVLRLGLLCLTPALLAGCGLSESPEETPPAIEARDAGTEDAGSPADAGAAGDAGHASDGGLSADSGVPEDPWHCATGNWTAVAGEPGVYSVTTAHYALTFEVGSAERAEELGRMAEAAYQAFSSWFESAPELDAAERLAVSFYSTEARFQAALKAIGVSASGIGGYYDPGSRTAYLYEQPNPNYTNVLYVHEMAHQFHYLARTGNQNRPSWYVEGLAEHLSRHDWDGQCIRLGVVSMLSWEDLPRKALDEVAQSGLDAASILSGTTVPSRAVSWAITSYLERGEGRTKTDAFAAYRALMDGGSAAGPEAFEALLGPLSSIELGIAGWLPEAQEPLEPIYTEWMHVSPGTVRSLRTGRLTLARVKRPHSSFEVSIDERSSGAYAGVLAGFTDTSNYVAYLVGDDLQISEFKLVGGTASWNLIGKGVKPGEGGSFTWTVSHAGADTQVTVNGVSLSAAGGFQPASGPAAYDADAKFARMNWQ